MAKLAALIPKAKEQNGVVPGRLHVGDLFHRYWPQGELGRGPVATVYRAVEQQNGQNVALKLFDARFREEPRFAIRFRRHLQSVLGLKHSHLVKVRDYGLAGDHFYIVTDLVDGLNLATVLTEGGALPPAAAATVAHQICIALAAAHEHGLVHRNLKPENVLLSEDGPVQVADVGLSGLLSESGLSQTSVMLRGVDYMAPEQGRGKTAGPAADIYSTGVILFEMLTGRAPFASADVWQVVQMHLQANPPSPRALNPDIPQELASIVTRALSKQPLDRFATADDMATALAPHAPAGNNFDLPPSPSQPATRRQSVKLPALVDRVKNRIRHQVSRLPLAHRLGGVSRLGLLLGTQFLLSFIIVFLLLLALTGPGAGNAEPAAAGHVPHRRSITKPLVATPMPAATATSVPETTPTVAAVRQAPAGSGRIGGEGGPPGDDGPPPWAGGPPPWANARGQRGGP